MLNEFYQIYRGLEAAGVVAETRHPDIAPLAKRTVVVAKIDGSCIVKSLGLIEAKNAPVFWTLRDGNHNSFPLIQIGGASKPQPLRSGGDPELVALLSDEKKPVNARLGAFNELIQSSKADVSKLLPWPGYRQRLQDRLDQMDCLRSTDSKNVVILLERVLHTDGRNPLVSLIDAIERRVRDMPDAAILGVAAKLLFVGGGEVLLELADVPRSERSACDPKNIHELTRALSHFSSDGFKGTCAISGKRDQTIETDTFPQARLPLLGPSVLFSKNAAAPCTSRYSAGGAASILVSRTLASELQSSIEWLCSGPREHKTWSRIPGEKPKQFDLFLTYCPCAEDAKLAAAMAEDEAAFEALASPPQKLIRGRAASTAPEVKFVVLRKVDPGNRKAIYSASSDLSRLSAAADRWKNGCRNTPDVRLPIPHGRGTPAEYAGPRLLTPGRLVLLGKELFTNGGTKRQQAPGPSFADAMKLLLDTEIQQARSAARLLREFTRRRGQLLVGIAHARRRSDYEGFDSQAALDSVTVVGLMLHMLGRNKEAYMGDSAFRLGQLLAAADILHRGYCEHQRAGSIPSALLGNQVMGLAQRSPLTAIAQLSRRWRVYGGWAAKFRDRIPKPTKNSNPAGSLTDDERRARKKQWSIYSAVQLGRMLHDLGSTMHGKLPESADDRFRAELMLGYLAGLDWSRSDSNRPNTDSKTISEQE